MGLYEPSEGRIRVLDEAGRPIEMPTRFAISSAVLQQIYQYAMSIAENISFTALEDCDMARAEAAAREAGLGETIAALPAGLATMLRRDYHPEGISLSIGQAQKLALARALYRDAPLLVLDEPTSALDALAERDFYARFHALFPDRTCLFISHRLSSVLFCDRVLLIDDGRIAGFATHDELLHRNALYRRMWRAQSQAYQVDHA